MNLLLDSNVFVFMLREPERISLTALAAIQSPDNELFLSSVSSWELIQKQRVGKLALPPMSFPEMRETLGVLELPFEESAALHLESLPDHHRDPFDRMIVCQSIDTGYPIISSDRVLRAYPIQILW